MTEFFVSKEKLVIPSFILVLEFRSVKLHFTPTISAKIATGHIDDKIFLVLIVKVPLIITELGTGSWRERVYRPER